MASSSSSPATTSYCDVQPPTQRGIKNINKLNFNLNLPVLAAKVEALNTTKFTRSQAKNYLLRLPRRSASILPDPTSINHRLVYLGIDPSLPIPEELVQILKEAEIPELIEQVVTLDYDYWTSDQIINAVLPEELLNESPSAFTQVGHIAHLNIRAEYLPYRHLIGQIILDKNKSLRTVVNKLDTIDNEFRNFKMEVLAGEDDFNVTTSESNCTFKFDFSLVYWNSRLQSEHLKLVSTFPPTCLIVDAFAGVGPFAIPSAKKGCAVLASDLNPASASALLNNSKLNKVESNLRWGNEDARKFIRESVVDVWKKPFEGYTVPISAKMAGKLRRSKEAAKLEAVSLGLESVSLSTSTEENSEEPEAPKRNLVDHFIMNLPGSALEFLDCFRGLYIPLYELEGAKEAIELKGGKEKLPMVHCYCFTKDMEDQEGDILARASKSMGLPVTKDLIDYNLRFIRDVAPKKEMYCLEFRLSEEMVSTV